MFEWIESARIARLEHFEWRVAANLDAGGAQCKAEFDSLTAETDSPLSVAVGLIVRQELTGRELPSTAEKVVKNGGACSAMQASILRSPKPHPRSGAVCEPLQEYHRRFGLPIDLDDPMDGETNPEDIETVDQSDESDSVSPEDVADEESQKLRQRTRQRPSRWMRGYGRGSG